MSVTKEQMEMARWIHRGCLICDERLFGGDDCEGIFSPDTEQGKCYATKQAILDLILAPAPQPSVTREAFEKAFNDYLDATPADYTFKPEVSYYYLSVDEYLDVLRSIGIRVVDEAGKEE